MLRSRLSVEEGRGNENVRTIFTRVVCVGVTWPALRAGRKRRRRRAVVQPRKKAFRRACRRRRTRAPNQRQPQRAIDSARRRRPVSGGDANTDAKMHRHRKHCTTPPVIYEWAREFLSLSLIHPHRATAAEKFATFLYYSNRRK